MSPSQINYSPLFSLFSFPLKKILCLFQQNTACFKQLIMQHARLLLMLRRAQGGNVHVGEGPGALPVARVGVWVLPG